MASQAKKDLRAAIKHKLAGLDADAVQDQSDRGQHLILSLPQYKNAQRIGIYLSMPTGEAQTELLIRDALGSEKEVFVPHVFAVGSEKPKRKLMDMLRLPTVGEYENLERDSWGIPKLPVHGLANRENARGGLGRSYALDGTETICETVQGLDVIVVPGVAFDRQMGRLGHGAGFYDAFLARFCDNGARTKPFLGRPS